MASKSALWLLEPHTKGKHEVLRYYLDAWLPIRGMRWNKRLLFIDGFAGPGQYRGGEEGSPLIALRALRDHSAQGKIKAEVAYLFIEKDVGRAQHLKSIIEAWRPTLPPNCTVEVIPGAFDDTMTEALDYLDTQAQKLAPAFVMVDPFGVSETPMRVIERILRNSESEVYVSFMYESINRFKTTPEFAPHLDELFGCKEWRDGIEIQDTDARKNYFYGLYENQLRRAGAVYVVHFDLYEGNRLVYAIFFGTKHTTGCDRMKQAIWKVAPFGDFAFRGTKSEQLTLGIATPTFEPLKENLRRKFGGKGWVRVESIHEFVASDETDYHTNHYKRHALKPMEAAGEIEIDENTRNRKSTYPDGTRLRFL